MARNLFEVKPGTAQQPLSSGKNLFEEPAVNNPAPIQDLNLEQPTPAQPATPATQTGGRNLFDLGKPEAPETTLLSADGLRTMTDVASVGLAKAFNTAVAMFNREDDFTSLADLTQEDRQYMRSLQDQGMDDRTAFSEMVRKAQADRASLQQSQDAQLVRNRNVADEAIDDALPENMSEPLRLGTLGTASLAQSVPAVVTGAMTRNPQLALTVAGAPAFIEGMGNTMQSGGSYEKGLASGTLQAGAEVLGEAIPMGALLKHMGKNKFTKVVGEFVVKETLTELPTTFTQDLISWVMDNPEKGIEEFMSEAGANLVDTAIITPFTAGIGGSIAHGIGGGLRRKKPEEEVEPLLKERAKAQAEKRDADVEVLDNQIEMKLAEMKPTLNDEGGDPIYELTPEQLQAVETLDPLSDDEVKARVDAKVPPLNPELQNDGTRGIGMDTAFGEDNQIGNTMKVMKNAEGYEPDPNDAIPRSQRKVMFGPEGAVGQQIGTLKTGPGTYTIGEVSDARGADYLEATHQLYEELRARFMPNATIILSGETMNTRQAIGKTTKLDSGEYLIVPAQARMLEATDANGKLTPKTFNASTKSKVLDNIFHEFGHSLMMERFFENVAPEARLAFQAEQQNGQFTEETMARFSPEQAALMRSYNEFRANMKGKNAAWFQHEWMSPALAMQRQLTKEVIGSPDGNAMSFVRRLVSRGNPQAETLRVQAQLEKNPQRRQQLTAERDALIDSMTADYLSFDEFVAEQMARYAYNKNLGMTGKAGELLGGGRGYVAQEEQVRAEGLKAALKDIQKSLRDLFIALKKGITLENGETWKIKAGTTFEQWLQSLSRTGQLMEPKTIKTEVKGTRKPKQKAKLKVPKIAPTATAQELRKTITFGKFTPAEKQSLYKLVRENNLVAAQEEMIKMLDRRVKHQLDVSPETGSAFAGLTEEQAKNPKVRAVAIRAWNRMKERSMFFKAYFGDWESGQGSKVVDAEGRPLVHYHATQGDFDTFKFGDIGFHIGNITAAHSRLYKIAPANARNSEAFKADVQARIDMAEYRGKRESATYADTDGGTIFTPKELDWNIVPLYANIRNPLELSENGRTDMWNDPISFADKLTDDGILTPQERAEVMQEQLDFMKEFDITQQQILSVGGNKIRYQMFQKLRQRLIDKGFDGIKYENYVEGGTSWVAFKSSQLKTANATFSNSRKIHYQRNVDHATTTGLNVGSLSTTIEKYENMGKTATALNAMARMQWYVLQQQHLAWIHPEFHFLDMANNASQAYVAAKSRLQATGEKVAQKWKMLGKEEDAKLSKALEAEAEGKVHWTKLEKNENGKLVHTITADTLAQLKRFGLDIEKTSTREAVEVYLESKNVLLQQLNAAQVAIARRLGMKYGDSPEFEMRLQDLRKTFAEIRMTPFLPRGDYGSWGFVIEEQDGLNKKIVYRKLFETNKDFQKGLEIAEKNLKPGQRTRIISKLRDENKGLLALPREYVEQAADVLDLTEDQRDMLEDLLHPVKTDKILAPYEKAIEKIGGGSKDRMRNFADFVWHNSTMIARTEAQPALESAKRAASQMIRDVDTTDGISARARIKLIQDIKRAKMFVDKTAGYMLSPPNEWYGARSIVAITYLWGSLKTAALNLVGIITTQSALASQYGDIAGGAALARAHKDLALLLTKGESTHPEVDTLYNRAIEEGFLVQNYAAHLAGAATAGVAHRLGNRNRWIAGMNQQVTKAADFGMIPFTAAEQYTRRITFIAQVHALVANNAKQGKGSNMEAIYAEAIKQTDLLQNSYTLANRPQIMRGGTGITSGLIPLVTIFLSFMGHFTFNAAGGYTLGATRRGQMGLGQLPQSYVSNTMRMLTMLLLLGGLEALPGMENILDILDVISMALSKKPLRQHMREGIQALPDAGVLNDPRWWFKGLGGDVNLFGLGNFDVSASLGIGRLVPGTDALAGSPTNSTELLGRMATSAGGVTGSLLSWGTQFSLDAWNGRDLTKNFERFPGFVGGVASAASWSKDGVRGSQGELIHKPTTGEVIGKAMNFNPSAVSEKREIAWAKKQALMYWTTRSRTLVENYNLAMDKGDREFLADTLKKVDEFNSEVVDPKMRLMRFELMRSWRAHMKKQRALENNIAPSNARNLFEEIDQSFDDGGE